MGYIEDLEDETSNLVLVAEMDKTPGAFKRAALKEVEAAKVLADRGIKRSIHHLFSAGWCAYHAKDKELAGTIVDRIDEIADLDPFFSKEKKSIRASIKML